MKRLLISGLSIFCLLGLLGSNHGPPQKMNHPGPMSPSLEAINDLPLYFIQNSGQFHRDVKYSLNMPNGNAFFSDEGITYQFIKTIEKNHHPEDRIFPPKEESPQHLKIENIQLRFKGRNESIHLEGMDPSPARFHFYRGKNPAQWVKDNAAFHRIVYHDLYPGIDLVVYGCEGMIKHEYRVKKGGRPEDIVVGYDGIEDLAVNRDDQLEISTGARILIEDAPLSFQIINGEKIPIESEYTLKAGNTCGFSVGKYDREQDLIIDPSLFYSTYFGGSGRDGASDIAIDLHLNAYIVGSTSSADFPTTPGAYEVTLAQSDVFLTKLDSTGTQILFSTYFGGSGSDGGGCIAYSWSDECLVITGTTRSSDLPTTSQAYDRILGGSSDIFVAKFSDTGDLIFSTLLGGSDNDGYADMGIDGEGNIYVAGLTTSPDFVTTPNAIDRTFHIDPSGENPENIFVAKFNRSGSSLRYSTFFGKSGLLFGGMCVDYEGNAYITGHFYNYYDWDKIPTTPGVYKETCDNWWGDAFVAKINPRGDQLVYSTYHGDVQWENKVMPDAIAVDGQGDVYVLLTYKDDSIPKYNPIVSKFNADATDMLFSRRVDRDNYFYAFGYDIVCDGRGGLYIVGITDSGHFPVTEDAFQKNLLGANEWGYGPYSIFIVKMNAKNGDIIYSTLFGGSDCDYGSGIAADSFGAVYVAGTTYSRDFPATPNALFSSFQGEGDAVIARIKDRGAEGEIELNKTELVFNTPYQAAHTRTKTFQVKNARRGVISYNVTANKNWIQVSPDTGDVRDEADGIEVTVDTNTLKRGAHTGAVRVASLDAWNSPQQILVTVKVEGPKIKLGRKKFTINAAEGWENPIYRKGRIRNKGPGTLKYRIKSLVSWLSVTPKSGESSGEWDYFQVKAEVADLEAGVYQGMIEFSSRNATNSPENIVVTLNIQ